jgi:hypothetical protein
LCAYSVPSLKNGRNLHPYKMRSSLSEAACCMEGKT